MMNYTPSRRDWTEDFEHENGQYLCNCKKCGETFMGHKRRPLCKSCDKPRWIAHVTDEMPKRLKPDTLVNVVFGTCKAVYGPNTASYFNDERNILCRWSGGWMALPIIAYQISEETK